MKKLIHNLRQKPPHVRRIIALSTSVVVTGILGIIWISNLVAVNAVPSPDTNNEDKTPSPFALMFDQMNDFFKSAGSDLAEVSSAFGFLEGTTTVSDPRDVIATSTDGSVGVSATNYESDNSEINSTTQ